VKFESQSLFFSLADMRYLKREADEVRMDGLLDLALLIEWMRTFLKDSEGSGRG
jgi:hypothetical protein